ncbi:DUF368 domain-containing protein [Methanocaldococcus infernus]
MKEELKIFLKGILMGIADIIPGISGGTIAFITGIYERLIKAISNLNIHFLIYLIKGDIERAKHYLKKIDFQLFIPLALGIGSAFLVMSHIIVFLLQSYSSLVYSLFSGLIIGSSILIYREIKEINIFSVIFFFLGFLLAFFISGSSSVMLTRSPLTLFLSGFLASCAMILPGISGSYILLFLNQYEYVINLVKNLDILKLSIFGLGAFLGLFIFSKILSYAFEKYRSLILSFLVGVMLGALRYPLSKVSFSLTSTIILLSGFLLVLTLERLAKKKAPECYNQQ